MIAGAGPAEKTAEVPTELQGRPRIEVPRELLETGEIELDHDSSDFAPPSTSVLRAAWEPPVILYSDAYVQWQLEFPGAKAITVSARSSLSASVPP